MLAALACVSPAMAAKPVKRGAPSKEIAFYRCKDANGQTHFGDSKPAACEGLDTEVVGKNGVVLEVLEGTAVGSHHRQIDIEPHMSCVSFIDLCLELGVLRFGEFKLKSGRTSPYFFNAGLFNSGRALAELGRHYAALIQSAGLQFDVLFGPAYKGIPLVATAAVALADHHGRSVPWAFNRKEAKDHGEGGNIVGAPLRGRVLIIDDVITAGTAIRESIEIIRTAGATPVGVVLALDRQERGQTALSAVQEVEQQLGLPVKSILKLGDLISHLQAAGDAGQLAAVQRYKNEYGVAV